MISITEIEVSGWRAAIRGMRNPKNSWDRSDTIFLGNDLPILGDNDLQLMKQLAKFGDEHAKYLRFIDISMDIVAPLYWWKEFDTYKIGTVSNSCSTMHKLASRDLTPEDFSMDHLWCWYNGESDLGSEECMNQIIYTINKYRARYVEIGDKQDWWQLIQLLPSSYNQRRTVKFNYQVAHRIVQQRKNHKLDEWREFVETLERLLPYYKEIFDA